MLLIYVFWTVIQIHLLCAKYLTEHLGHWWMTEVTDVQYGFRCYLELCSSLRKYRFNLVSDCVCRNWRSRFRSRQKMDASLSRWWSSIIPVLPRSWRWNIFQKPKSVRRRRWSSIFHLKASNFSCLFNLVIQYIREGQLRHFDFDYITMFPM